MRPQTIVERLDFVAKRIPGLKFTPPTQLKCDDDQLYGCFMSCDMFYIELKVDQSHQSVKDVFVNNTNTADGIMPCPVLKKILADQDFETFAKHLSGIHSIYQINTNDKKVKQKAYPALTALENDLAILYEHQRRRVSNFQDLVHKSPIGFMESRKGGLPVKLTYFITPYDLIDTTLKSSISLTANNIVDKNLGLSATVEIEGSNPHKIQIKSLITQHNSSLPIYAPFNGSNSEKLPAQFVLNLSQPFPMLKTSISQMINEINEPATIKEYLSSIMTSSKESIISLIARQELDLNKGPFCRTVDSLKGADIELCDLKKHVYSIKLPDQSHTYHIMDSYLERPDAVYVTKIPFTHPTSIPSILKVLRQQALFNFVLGSCIRRNKGTSSGTNTVTSNIDENLTNNPVMPNIFDVLPVSLNSICVAFEHPSRESLATLELDIKEISCQLYALDKESVCSNEFATKVMQRCWSIPVTLRSVLKKCNERRLALLEDSNKRRERELQELLSNNPSTQQNLQMKSNLKYRETLSQSNPNVSNERPNTRDLNSIAEFLSSKVNNANASDNLRQTETNSDSSSRTNLLKKFSCKPKVKQNTTTKSQIGNKILSQMLKRQNSTIVIDDPVLRGPATKKIKTKNTSGESSSMETTANPVPTTTKLISPEVASAARMMNKQAKQAGKSQNISLSLIRAPPKMQASAMSGSSLPTMRVGLTLTPNQKQPDPLVQKMKAHMNGAGSPVEVEGTRKTSINAIIDKICLGVNDEKDGKNDLDLQSDQHNAPNMSMEGNRSVDLKGTSNGGKLKTRIPGGDQFAIKQGSSGGGLKLTVTKTKPSNPTTPSSSTLMNTSSANSNISTPNAIPTTSSTSTSTSSNASSSNNPNAKQSDASKIIELGLAAPSIRYTIPKISKTQQASQSNTSNANSSDHSAAINTNDTNQQTDDSNNPSSSGNSSTAPSSTTTKRTTSNPFNRNGTNNRNPVTSSTHPPNRTTSNPLANALSRPSSTSNIDNHVLNRISSSSNNANNPRQPQLSRPMNLMPQTRMQVIPQTIINQPPQFNVAQRFMNAGLIAQPSQTSLPLIGQPLPQQMFALRMQQQPGVFSNPNDLNIIAANQVAMLNQQQQLQRQQISQQPLSNQIQHIQQNQQVSVSSSSDTGGEDRKLVSNSQAATSSSTPSSPTECDQAETNAPPPLIPIDSLHEARPVSPEEHDDASDRLSIVDMVDFADGNSLAGTPRPSDVSSPMEVVQDLNSATSSSTPAVQTDVGWSAPASTSASAMDTGSATTLPSASATASAAETGRTNVNASASEAVSESTSSSFVSGPSDLASVLVATSHNIDPVPSGPAATIAEADAQLPESSLNAETDTGITTQSPQSTVAATSQNE